MTEYKYENITMLNTDCEEYMKTIPDNHFELAIVDPPYGTNTATAGNGSRRRIYDRSQSKNWDKDIPSKEYFSELFRVSKNQIIWGANYYLEYLRNTKCFLIYDKKQPEGVTFASCEMAWTSFNSVAKTFYYSPMSQNNRIHSCQKPIPLYEWILKNYAKQGDKILDTHGGSFSSAIACHKHGFEYVGTELDVEYFDLAVDRFKTYASQMNLFAEGA